MCIMVYVKMVTVYHKLNVVIYHTLTVTSETSHILRLLISLCVFHDDFLSLIPVLIFTVRGISRTFNIKNATLK